MGPEDWEWTDAVGLLTVSVAGNTRTDLYIDGRGGRSIGAQSDGIGNCFRYYDCPKRCRIRWRRHRTTPLLLPGAAVLPEA